MKRNNSPRNYPSERSTVGLKGHEAKTGYSPPQKGKWLSRSDQLKEIFQIRQELSDLSEDRPDIQSCLRKIPADDIDSLNDLLESVHYSLESGTDINPDYYPVR